MRVEKTVSLMYGNGKIYFPLRCSKHNVERNEVDIWTVASCLEAAAVKMHRKCFIVHFNFIQQVTE